MVEEINQSDYRFFSLLRYRRRLAEIHVGWVNALFLVLGSALIVLDFGGSIVGQKTDWMHLILFLVALRYAANGLQQIASSTVAFSRFLPESELVFQILNPNPKPKDLSESGLVFYFDSRSDVEQLIPQLLKLNYGVEQAVLLTGDPKQDKIITAAHLSTLWVFSGSPVLFKQAVKRHQKSIKKVVCRIGAEVKKYNDLSLFFKEFDSQQIISQNKLHEFDTDDEIY